LENKDISLKDLILLIGQYGREILRNWWIIVISIILFLVFFVHKTNNTPATFNAKTKFLVEGNEGGGLGSIGGLLGNLGISKGGKSNPMKIIEVALSKRMAAIILFSKSQCSEGLIANDIITQYELNERHSKK